MTAVARLTRGFAMAAVFAMTSAVAQAQNWYTTMSGAAEAPPNPSAGTGFATFNVTGNLLTIAINFTGLTGTTTQAHVHCCVATPGAGTVGVATELPLFTGFPVGVRNGSYLHTFDMTLNSTWSAAFITANGGTTAGATAAFIAGMNNGRAYLNIHTTQVPAGEIRGFISVVPEPSTYLMMGTGVLGLLGIARRRRTAA